MPKPPDPEAPRRRDGYFERRARWGEVTIGTLIAGSNRTDVWEVIDSRAPDQYSYGMTPWFLTRNRVTGEILSVQPRPVKGLLTVLTPEEDTALPPRTPGSDAEAVALLVRELGAQEIATQDRESGEITCPAWEKMVRDDSGEYERHHLLVAHNVDATGLDAAERATLHGKAHERRFPDIGKGGFPHRHVPEDHSIL